MGPEKQKADRAVIRKGGEARRKDGSIRRKSWMDLESALARKQKRRNRRRETEGQVTVGPD